MPLKKMAEVCGEFVEVQLMQNPLGADKENKRFIPNWDFYEMKWADVIMVSNINNYGGPYTLEIVKKGHELGKFVHFDTDDLLTELYEEHRLYGVYKDNQLDQITKVMYHNSHLVTVTQEFFASKIKEFVRCPLAIIRNAIDYNLPCWNVPKIPSKQVRIGWAGGIHHRPDVKVFAGIPNLVNQKVGKENIIWDFYGHPPPDIGKEDEWQKDAWKEYVNSFLVGIKKSSGPPNYRVHFARPPDDYGAMYANMDIAIAPLKYNLFNESKCFGEGEKVLMFDGSIKKVEDLIVGDQLMGPDSQPRNISKLFSGEAELVDLVRNKGRTIRVTKNHILSLKCNDANTLKAGIKPRYLNISVKDFLTSKKSVQYNYRLYTQEVTFEQNILDVDPYLVGIMLGDGSLGSQPAITTMDEPIAQYFSESASVYPTLKVRKDTKIEKNGRVNKASTYYATHGRFGPRTNPLMEKFKSIGLKGVTGKDKFIPQRYKIASRDDRLQILAGLIDTDGTLDGNKTSYIFTNKSKQLVEDFAFIARSLGLYASQVKPFQVISVCDTVYYKTGLSGNINIIPCKLERKKAGPRKCNRDPLTSGFKVVEAGIGRYYGFELDGDKLHLMDDFTVTHNSDIKTAEASRYKIPLIATDVGCYRDTIKNGKTGYLLPPDASAAEWSKVLVKVIKDKQHRISLGENLHNAVNNLFDINITIWDRLNLYLEVFKILNWKFK